MAAVHAVEVADGERDAVVAGLGKSADYLHAAIAGERLRENDPKMTGRL
jgi:hypothetical protein